LEKDRGTKIVRKNRTLKLDIMELIKVTNASYVKDFVIHFKFNNGVEKDINLEPEL
jgi:hypothetical protein